MVPAVTEVWRPHAAHCSSTFAKATKSTTATRTAETVRPAQPEQILPAGLRTAKTGLELCQVPRIIFHLQAYYILGLPESTGYPSNRNSLTRQPRLVEPSRQTRPRPHTSSQAKQIFITRSSNHLTPRHPANPPTQVHTIPGRPSSKILPTPAEGVPRSRRKQQRRGCESARPRRKVRKPSAF